MRKSYGCLAVMTCFILFSMTGCAGFAKIKSIPGYDQRIGFKELEKNWARYDILYTGLSDNRPEAVIFMIKAADRVVEGKTWIRIEDKAVLTEIIDLIRLSARYDPRLWKMEDPGGRDLGYVFSGRNDIVIDVGDKNTLYIRPLIPLPGGPG